jgi:hypothetical protein
MLVSVVPFNPEMPLNTPLAIFANFHRRPWRVAGLKDF